MILPVLAQQHALDPTARKPATTDDPTAGGSTGRSTPDEPVLVEVSPARLEDARALAQQGQAAEDQARVAPTPLSARGEAPRTADHGLPGDDEAALRLAARERREALTAQPPSASDVARAAAAHQRVTAARNAMTEPAAPEVRPEPEARAPAVSVETTTPVDVDDVDADASTDSPTDRLPADLVAPRPESSSVADSEGSSRLPTGVAAAHPEDATTTTGRGSSPAGHGTAAPPSPPPSPGRSDGAPLSPLDE
ncbi:MAG: hypothetical protein AAF533_21575 [Acidobacteriota bacterium]